MEWFMLSHVLDLLKLSNMVLLKLLALVVCWTKQLTQVCDFQLIHCSMLSLLFLWCAVSCNLTAEWFSL